MTVSVCSREYKLHIDLALLLLFLCHFMRLTFDNCQISTFPLHQSCIKCMDFCVFNDFTLGCSDTFVKFLVFTFKCRLTDCPKPSTVVSSVSEKYVYYFCRRDGNLCKLKMLQKGYRKAQKCHFKKKIVKKRFFN